MSENPRPRPIGKCDSVEKGEPELELEKLASENVELMLGVRRNDERPCGDTESDAKCVSGDGV